MLRSFTPRAFFARIAASTLLMTAILSSPFSHARPLVLEELARVTVPGANDQLIIGVAVSGDTMLIAGRRNFNDASEQFAYLFQRDANGSWVYVRTLATTSAPNQLTPPMKVGVRGNIAAINTDRLSIYERLATGWTLVATLPSGNSLDMEIDTGTILLSYPQCAWQAFRKGASGWASSFSVGGSPTCHSQDVDIAGSTVVAANPFFTVPSGLVWPDRIRIFRGFTSATPTFVTDPTEDPRTPFGEPVAIEGGTVYAGRPGGTLAFERGADGVWRLQATMEPADSPRLGNGSMDAVGSFVAVGHGDDRQRLDVPGSVRVFQRNSATSYSEVATLLASDGARGPMLASEIRIDGRLIAVNGISTVHLFRLPLNLQVPALLQDDFQDGDASGWTPSIASWSVATAGGSRVYRQSHLTASNVRSILSRALQANQSVEARVTPTQFAGPDRWFGVITRYTDADNYYYLSVRNSNQVLLRRLRRGVFTTLDSAPLPVRANQTYRVRVEAIGTRLRGYVNDQLLVEATDRSMRTGRPGLITFGARADFDNVVVTPSPLRAIFEDNFEGQFISDSWRVASGNWQHLWREDVVTHTLLGSYAQTSATGDARVIAGVSTNDQSVEADATAPALATGASFGVLARYTDSGNYYQLRVQAQDRIALRKLVNGSSYELASARFTRTPGTRDRFRLEVLGDALRAYVNARQVMEVRDATHRAGKYGLATSRTTAEFDNVIVIQP